MSQRFINDHSVSKVELSKIIEITAGGFHAWCESNVGKIRKPNYAIPQMLWDSFCGIEIIETGSFELKWYQRVWIWILTLIRKWLKK